MRSGFLSAIPEDARDDVARLLDEPPAEREELVGEVRSHGKLLREAAQVTGRVDAREAPELTALALALLARLDELQDPEARAVIQAAVRYFELDADADGDFDSLQGLADDRAVLETARRYVTGG